MRALLPALLLSAGALCAATEEMAVLSPLRPSNQGAEAARSLGKCIQNGKGVILLRDRIDAHASESAEESFLQTILTEFPNTPILVSDYHTGNSPESAQRIARGLFATHRENLGGVFASSEKAVVGAIAALKSLGIKIPLVGRVNHFKTAQALKNTYPAFIAQIAAPDGDEPIDIPFGNEAEPLAQKSFKLKPGDRRIDSIGLELVQIPGGELNMGASQTLTITLSPFYIGRFEITQAQWAFIMEENPSVFKTPQRPVDNVSWEQAVDFCQKLTDYARKIKAIDANERFQLPTEAQWEYACLAGNKETSIDEMDSVAWQMRTSGRAYKQPFPGRADGSPHIRRMSTQPVGTQAPNAWGIFDMYGNVNEWCLDFWQPLPQGAYSDFVQTAKSAHRVLKGGCWWADPQSCQVSKRHKAPPWRHHSALGLRVALIKEK